MGCIVHLKNSELMTHLLNSNQESSDETIREAPCGLVSDCEKNRKNELQKFDRIHKKIQSYQDCSRDTKLAPLDNNQEARMADFFGCCMGSWNVYFWY